MNKPKIPAALHRPRTKHPNVRCDIGPLGKVDARHYSPERVVLDVPQRVTNSSSTATYTSPKWNVRDGADQHLQYRSRGF